MNALDALCVYFEKLSANNLDELDIYYATDVWFKDPFHEVTGVDAIRANPNVEVVPQTSMQFREALDLYKKMADKEWSLTDCASFEIMKARGISEALAHDHHFEQAGFIALLRN